ncbi:hypothetical protein [uncultured Tateyamaria sp.]|uniref:hypothetical protein n=1 Tax=uncultured Tateyamaria sp. TaxID=455651 RepID=UPI002607A0CD|nr:hypothetical protein [uncultured Tateyamaria sp.]
MAMQYKKIFIGEGGGVDVDKADVASIATELGKYLKANGMQAQGIKLPGLKKAGSLIQKSAAILEKSRNSPLAQEMGMSPELKVVAGIDTKGDMSATITGLLPPSKSGKPPINFDKTEVIRKGWTALEAELSNETNVVVNLTKKNLQIIEGALEPLLKKYNGDMAALHKDAKFQKLLAKYNDGDVKVINKAAEKQAKKFQTPAVDTLAADFGEMTTGTVILAAHGSRVKEQGKTVGTKLGRKTPEQIVALLTEQSDKSKNLSKDFKGTVLLSGCFTAAGGIPPSDDYDYAPFAQKVWNLLKKKGIKCKVSGLPGQARTDADGNKKSVIPTEQDEYDALKQEVADLKAEWKKQQAKFDKGDKKAKAAANKKIKELMPKLKKANASKEAKVMNELIMSYGLDPVR